MLASSPLFYYTGSCYGPPAPVSFKIKKPLAQCQGLFFNAEKEGFEPPDLLQSAVFKTAAIDHSATSLEK